MNNKNIIDIGADLDRATEEGWVSAWAESDDTFTVDHHNEEGDEVRTSFTRDDYEASVNETTYNKSDPNAVLAYALNVKGKIVRNFAHPDDRVGWGDIL